MARIHVFGASGSGTTTLGRALSAALEVPFLDSDDYYWLPTEPPFMTKREPADRVALIEGDITGQQNWVLSGSLCSWGEPLLHHFTLAVFLTLAPTLRMQRLAAREALRYGARIAAGGDLRARHLEFMEWAASYDSARAPTRSLDLHESWWPRLACPVLRLDSALPVTDLLGAVRAAAGIDHGGTP
jgi:adenylate kinase family enzyme